MGLTCAAYAKTLGATVIVTGTGDDALRLDVASEVGADHTIDVVIFFSDPMTEKIHDADFIALTRLAVVHDTPIACSPAAADLFVSARLLTRKLTIDPGEE